MSVRVAAARDVGGFTESRGCREEESIARPLRRRHGDQTVQFFPDLVMLHDFDVSVRDTLLRARSYGRTYGRDWVKDRGIPTLRPLPLVAVLTAGLVAVRSIRVAAATLVLSPLFLYRRWIAGIREGGGPEVLAYPYVQALEDVAGNVGFVEGWSRPAAAELARGVQPA
jgi:hypothetical protein